MPRPAPVTTADRRAEEAAEPAGEGPVEAAGEGPVEAALFMGKM
jgi:hypothetical protein